MEEISLIDLFTYSVICSYVQIQLHFKNEILIVMTILNDYNEL